MRAKEYAELFNKNRSIENLIEISGRFVKECIEIAETRKAKSDSALIAILNEQDLKWKAFARLIDGVKPDGFEQLVKLQLPEVHKVWKN